MRYDSFSDQVEVIPVDPYRDFEVLKNLGSLGQNFQRNSILVKAGNRHRYLSSDELAVYDRKLERFGIQPKLVSFTGELAISGALLDLSDSSPPAIGLVANHGEKDPMNEKEGGISTLIRNCSLMGFKMTLVDLTKLTSIPSEIRVLASENRTDLISDTQTISSRLRCSNQGFHHCESTFDEL